MSVPTYFYSHPRCSFFPPSGGIREIIALIYGDDKPLPYRIKGVKSLLKMYNLRLPLNPIEEAYFKKILRDNSRSRKWYEDDGDVLSSIFKK